MIKAVMYHYVRPSSDEFPYLRYLSLENFQRQLDHFQETYPLLTQTEFLEVLKGKSSKNGMVLTFDDGLRDHIDFVLPELKRRGLWGIFYVPTGPYENQEVLGNHKIHYLLGAHGGKRMLEALERYLEPEMLTDKNIQAFRERTYFYQTNSESTTEFKRALNFYISYEWRDRVLNQLMKEFFPNADRLLKNTYMSPEEVSLLQKEGMWVGSHGVNHLLFSKLSEKDQTYEIENSFGFLDKAVGGLPLRTFCYPYGHGHSFTPLTERLLTESQCLFSFNVEPRDIDENDIRCRPQALPRYDCNAFPFGQASGRV